jgi:hypothetical protein
VGGDVDMFDNGNGEYKATITYGILMPNPNEIIKILGTDPLESVEVKADSLEALENECKKVIRKKERLEDYEVIQGWRCKD